MDPYTLAYLAGHSDFSTTKRYVHPQTETVLAASNAPARQKPGIVLGIVPKKLEVIEKVGRGEWIRTTDLLVPNQAL